MPTDTGSRSPTSTSTAPSGSQRARRGGTRGSARHPRARLVGAAARGVRRSSARRATHSSTTRHARRSARSGRSTSTSGTTSSATNLRGTYLGCRVVGAHLRDRGAGRIVNLASVAGQASRAVTGVHYATSKAAIVALTRHAATELAPHGVTVERRRAGGDRRSDGARRSLARADRGDAETIPVGRLGRPEEVAALVAFLRLRRRGLHDRRDVRRQRRHVDAVTRAGSARSSIA